VRFFGKVGYSIPTPPVDGVWSDDITERTYKGEVLDDLRSIEESDKVNENIRLQSRISILADDFAFENFSHIKYVSWMGSLWTVNSVKPERPRLLLSLGGVYSGKRPT
jgi:hypothetical protein